MSLIDRNNKIGAGENDPQEGGTAIQQVVAVASAVGLFIDLCCDGLTQAFQTWSLGALIQPGFLSWSNR